MNTTQSTPTYHGTGHQSGAAPVDDTRPSGHDILREMSRIAAGYERDTSLSAETLNPEKVAAEAMRRLAGRA